jgi:hypothetical protein
VSSSAIRSNFRSEHLVGDRLEIPERLEKDVLQAKLVGHVADISGRTVEEQQVVLEQLEGVEPGRRDRQQLFLEGPAQGHRRD